MFSKCAATAVLNSRLGSSGTGKFLRTIVGKSRVFRRYLGRIPGPRVQELGAIEIALPVPSLSRLGDKSSPPLLVVPGHTEDMLSEARSEESAIGYQPPSTI